MMTKVKVKDIRANPFQSRKSQDSASIQALAEEIKKVGLWAGALRGREDNGKVQLCFGHRRLEAIKKLGWKEVEIDLVPLSDDDMAAQALIENLQREGLSDADKADGIVAYKKLLEKSQNVTYATFVDKAGRLFGYKENQLKELLRVASLSETAKEEIRAGRIKGRAAVDAAGFGETPEERDEAVKSAAKKGVGPWALEGMRKKLEEVKDPDVKKKIKEKVIKGQVTSPEEVVKKARQMQGAKKRDKAPPDLLVVIDGWTAQIKRWVRQLDEVIPYMEYIDSEPRVAADFRTAVNSLIERLQTFIYQDPRRHQEARSREKFL